MTQKKGSSPSLNLVNQLLESSRMLEIDSPASYLIETADYCGLLLYIENPALGVGFKRAYSDPYEKKTPFANIALRSANCNKAKGGH